MVTADNLNLDVLELIFLYLYGNDLSSVALVKKSFFAAVIPRLYRKIIFRLSHAKRYPQVMSPFQAILAHPALSTHVRCVGIIFSPGPARSFTGPSEASSPGYPVLDDVLFSTTSSILDSESHSIFSPSLISFVMRLPDLKITVGKELIEQLVTLQGSTLQSIAFVDCGVSQDSVLTIVTSCPNLQHFELPVSLKEGVFAFGNAIAKTTNLQTLIDTEIHSSHGHGPNVGLTQENARFFMKRVPSLRRIISGNRAWNWESKAPSGLVELSLERLPAYSSGTYWFMPRDVTGFSMN
ncbi:hypothetical protein BDP27DRAFT_1412473 [Rhodocollybia butyracea]|uniref:F-box domain-containing protein n=1 Tax=Rhodocollybia butyracea TaxID=206335 RepID=A0A9P5UGI8_9AGAR|nr:hypothetical protein BDP27DRAFT_1412473 [Rhodocollybia butyracea]